MTPGEGQLQRCGGSVPRPGLARLAVGQRDLFTPGTPLELDGDRQRQPAVTGLDYFRVTCLLKPLGAAEGRQVYGRRFATRRQAMDEVIDWLTFYNHRRLHSTLDYVSLMAFEQRWIAA